MAIPLSGPTSEGPADRGSGGAPDSASVEPGLVHVLASGRPAQGLLPLGPTALALGRGQGLLSELQDAMVSRRHAQAAYQDGLFVITDLGSRNGSAINGVPLQGTARVPAGSVIRLGHSLFLCSANLTPLRLLGVKSTERRVEGPALQQVLRTVAQIAASSRILFISGESGAGKEFLAQTFHSASEKREGPLIAVNCAAIPEGVAERLLFGARKGAFSGAVSDSEGYIEAADGGTLFLDEIADLDLLVQGKLLRVIESGELVPLGATRPRKVQVRICAATHKDLRLLVQDGKFRADLYFRIGMPHVTVPPLRERKEEQPWLIAQAVRSVAPELAVDFSLVETSLGRYWPGNVRELNAEIHSAALTARAMGASAVTAAHLRRDAGVQMQQAAGARITTPTPVLATPTLPMTPPAAAVDKNASPVGPRASAPAPSRAQVLAALIETEANISAAARSLNIHRTQLRRLIARYSIDLNKLRAVDAG